MTVLPLIWGIIIGFCVIMYVVLDGFTLGSCILLPFMRELQRDIALSMILPTWDGNQTWLVLGMASLYGAFPPAFSFLLPAFYMPLLLMVVALLLRGVAFEFRLKSRENKKQWDIALFGASLFIALVQGTIVANMVMGFSSPHYYLNGFSIFSALSLAMAYVLLGATRLVLKTTGELQQKMYQFATLAIKVVIVMFLIVCIWTPYVNPRLYRLWFDMRNFGGLIWLPIITAVLAGLLVISLQKRHEVLPYWLSVLFVLCPYVGFAVNLYPYAVPYRMTLWQAAAPANTLIFILIGASIMLPILLIYTGYAYHIFRGKVNDALHY